MNSFEGMQGQEVDPFQTGDRPDIHQETESHFDETLGKALDELKAGGFYRISDTMERLSAHKQATKEELLKSINKAGYDWGILSRMVKDAKSEHEVNAMIVEWAQEVEQAQDDAAIKNANKALTEKIENY
jgi:hypothetical protein